MSEPFNAIGFQVSDRAAYEALAVKAHHNGAISRAAREQLTLHGCCWRLGNGLEVWTVLHESTAGLVYADCRPAFRGRRTLRLHPWEIIEFANEGEAVVRAEIAGTRQELIFELQNLTEINPAALRNQSLKVAVAGLAYQVSFGKAQRSRKASALCQPLQQYLAESSPTRLIHENDYALRGTVLSWRALSNPLTTSDLLWIDLELDGFQLEVLINRAACPKALTRGMQLTAEVWLQGHILTEREQQLRYEGIDRETQRKDYWRHLRRHN